jgi:hypothetical protein
LADFVDLSAGNGFTGVCWYLKRTFSFPPWVCTVPGKDFGALFGFSGLCLMLVGVLAEGLA